MLSKRLTKGLSWLTDNGPRKAKHYWGRAKEKANEDELFGFGLWATVAYFLGPVLLLIVFAKWPSGLNEWGDFLAGAFGPVAFLWLVIGYLQQGKELRNSSEALKEQARELNAAVHQHEQMVRVTEAQLEQGQRAYAYSIAPTLNIKNVSRCNVRDNTKGSESLYFSLTGKIQNSGNSIHAVSISVTGNDIEYATTDSNIKHLDKGTSEKFSIRGPEGKHSRGVLLMEVQFSVPGNEVGIAFFRLTPNYNTKSNDDLEASLIFCEVNVSDREILDMQRKMHSIHL